VSGPQLHAGVHPAVLAAQPFAVEQVGAGEFRAELGAAQPVDPFAVAALGNFALAEQRAAARLDSQPEVGSTGPGEVRQPCECIASNACIAAACGGFDQLGQRPHRDIETGCVLAGLLGRC
jgi:hypothetical protein